MLAAIEKITEESYRVVKIIEEKKRCRTGWSSLPALAKKSERPLLFAGDPLALSVGGDSAVFGPGSYGLDVFGTGDA